MAKEKPPAPQKPAPRPAPKPNQPLKEDAPKRSWDPSPPPKTKR